MSANAPAQASDCQSSYGLMRELEDVTGTLAIGSLRSRVQYWLLRAREEQRRGLARDAGKREQHAGEDAGTAARRGPDAHLPLRHAEREAASRIAFGHQLQHLIGGSDDDRHDDQRQRHRTRQPEKCLRPRPR